MSMPYLDPEPEEPEVAASAEEPASVAPGEEVEPDTERAAEAEPLPVRTGWTLVSLIPHDGKEPPADLVDELAQAAWCAVSTPWHPALLSRAAELPRIEPIDAPTPPAAKEIRVVAGRGLEGLPSGYRTQAEDAGAIVIESGTDRHELLRALQEHLGAVGTPETSPDPGMIAIADDFLAMGTARWMLRDLAIAMGHPDAINHQALAREVLSGADAWQACDRTTATNRLRAGFEVLTQGRERFYPVDAYLVDLCLLDPAMPSGVLAGPLASHVAVSLLASALAIENQAERDPEGMAAVRQAIDDGWLDIAGGTYSEAEDAIYPLESILWQFRKGGDVYRAHLDGRTVETYARRRFGLYTQLPQIARRTGFRFALHMSFDAGRFPIRSEPKRLWESPDGSSLETLLRPPLAADRPAQGMMLPWRMGATMRNDHVATLPLVHWPEPVASWYLDLRRSATYSPVLARWVTLNDYFHLTDRPYETFRPDPDLYGSPYLAQAVARRDSDPISRPARHHRLRAQFEAVSTVQALASAIAATGAEQSTTGSTEGPVGLEEVETAVETGRHDEAGAVLDDLQASWAGRLATGIISARHGEPRSARAGYLVINPAGVSRRVAVDLPDGALDLRPEGPLRAALFTDEGVYAVVDVPAFGFAWVPAAANLEVPPGGSGGLSTRGRTLGNESIELEIDEATGGLRGIMAPGEVTPRMGQQLVVTGLGESDGKPLVSQMKGEKYEVDYAGPALVQATASGTLVDPRNGSRLARFTQRYRLWTGRPILEIDVSLSELDPAWSARAGQADPWTHYLGCRWAWPDPSSMVRRTVSLAPEMTELDRPETPDALDISTRRQRTSLLFGGLPYHRKLGGRMLDTLLVAGAEGARWFRLGVVLDMEYPFQAAVDLITPAPVVPAADGPPALGDRGWLIFVNHKAVAVTHVGFAPTTGEGRGWGLVIHLAETAGQSARCRLRFFRNPSWARQVDFQGETVIDLSVEGDAVPVDLTPNELARVEVTLG
jgi:alpha-mannosidase